MPSPDSSNGGVSPAGIGAKGEMCPPSDLMDLLHRNAVMVLEAAKQLESGPAGGCSLPQM